MKLINSYYLKKEKLVINHNDLLKHTKCTSKNLTAIKCNNIAARSQHTTSAYDYRKKINWDLGSPNIFLYVNSLLYGSCHDIAFFMSYLLEINGIESRILHLSNNKKNIINKMTHVALEAYYNYSWHFFDPTLEIYFLDEKEVKILSADEIKSQKTLNSNKEISLEKFKSLIMAQNERWRHA